MSRPVSKQKSRRRNTREVFVVEDATGAPHYLRCGSYGEAWAFVKRADAEAGCEPEDRVVRYVPAKGARR